MLNLLSCFQWFIGIPWGILEWLVIWKLFKSSPNISKIVDFLFFCFCFLMVQYINIEKTQPVSEMKSIISVKVMTALKYMYMYD